MKKRKVLTDIKSSRAVAACCCIVYIVSYLTRNTYPASIVALTGSRLITQSEAGLISTFYFIMYGTGHLVNGFLADRISPVLMLIVGMSGTVAANILMPAVMPAVPLMAVVWCLNGWFESMLFSPIVAIQTGMIAEKTRKRAMEAVSAAIPTGTIIAYFTTALCSYLNVGIAAPFIIAASVSLVVCVIFIITVKRAYSSDTAVYIEKAKEPSLSESGKNGASLMRLLITSGMVIFGIPVIFHGMLKEGVNTWVPSFLRDTFNTGDALSTLLAVALPVSSMVGIIIGNFLLNNKKLKKNYSAIGIIIMMARAIPIGVLLIAEKLPLAVGVICLCLISCLTMAFGHVFTVMLPTEFAKFGRASTVSGMCNALNYIGSAASIYIFGAVAESIGWTVTIILWLALTLISALILLFTIKPWRRFAADNSL